MPKSNAETAAAWAGFARISWVISTGAVSVLFGMLPETKTTAPNSPEAPGERQQRARGDGRAERRQHHLAERRPPPRSQDARCLLLRLVELQQDRLHASVRRAGA